MDNDIFQILSTSTFQNIINKDLIKKEQLNAATNLLIRMNIPFNLSFSQGTIDSPKTAQLSISINPSTEIQFTITFSE
ncbi:hypothetical protein KQH90_02315 [Anaerosalibacter bizertensis]|uniref:hypothetical protein n=1 Tax=Anaerosalibacter bizertensis TaxID=932217 RepID=UPI00176990CE|nr:hypothetical protein [Anaerosalibacter bizertensis]MBU5292872.1 hypothetical protein [Anaerosalibacter bizertensis]HHV25798.1 hypothetical protein [Tissierellia bacterium]